MRHAGEGRRLEDVSRERHAVLNGDVRRIGRCRHRAEPLFACAGHGLQGRAAFVLRSEEILLVCHHVEAVLCSTEDVLEETFIVADPDLGVEIPAPILPIRRQP
jgi:hypothetical protein